MSERLKLERRRLQDAGSTLAGHSMNQKKLGIALHAERTILGQTGTKARRDARRETAREERRQALYDGVNRIFNGSATEQDLVSVVVFFDEFNRNCDPAVNASLLDFRGLKPTEATFGEPQFFRK